MKLVRMFPCIDYFFLRLHCKKESFDILKIAFTGSCCSVFDMGIGRVVEDYTSPCAECPFVYQSNDFLNSKLFFFHKTSVDNFQLNHCRIYEFHIFFHKVLHVLNQRQKLIRLNWTSMEQHVSLYLQVVSTNVKIAQKMQRINNETNNLSKGGLLKSFLKIR